MKYPGRKFWLTFYAINLVAFLAWCDLLEKTATGAAIVTLVITYVTGNVAQKKVTETPQ